MMELCGPVRSVAAVNRWSEERSSVDAAVSALFRLEAGCTGSLEVDREARGREISSSIVVEGSTGALAIGWNARDRVELFLGGSDGPAGGPRRVERSTTCRIDPA
jgi:predicted dehydrogenase